MGVGHGALQVLHGESDVIMKWEFLAGIESGEKQLVSHEQLI